MGMCRSTVGRSRRAAVFMPVALLASSLGLSPLSLSFVACGDAGPQRRQALAGLLPLLAPAAATGAAHAADAPASSRIPVTLPDGNKCSFELPKKGTKDWVKSKNIQIVCEVLYERKDGSFIQVMPVDNGYVKARANAEAGPGNGFELKVWKTGAERDDLEWVNQATIYRGAQSGGAMPGGFLVQDGDPTSSHNWVRVLHTPGGDVLMSVAMNQEKYKEEGAALKAVLDSFRLEQKA